MQAGDYFTGAVVLTGVVVFTVVVVFTGLTGGLVATVVTAVGLGVVAMVLTAASVRMANNPERPSTIDAQKIFFTPESCPNPTTALGGRSRIVR